MHTGTGNLVTPQYFNDLPEQEKKQYVEVKRDLTAMEKYNMQIKMYSRCGCGSGKKFKFCCHKKSSAA